MESLKKVNDYYVGACRDDDKVWEFIEGSNLSDECVREFGLGYATREFGSVLSDRQTVEGKEQRKILKDLGVLGESTSKPVLLGLTVPFKDGGGDIVDLYSYNLNAQKSAPVDLYLESDRCGFVWNVDGDDMVLVDHPMDALALYSVGHQTNTPMLQNVVCAHDLNDGKFRVKFGGIKKVYLACDVDNEFKNFLNDMGVEIYTIHRNILNGSFFDLLKTKPKQALETITKVFSVPSLVSAPNVATALDKGADGGYTVSYDEVLGHHSITFPQRSYRVTGLFKNKGFDKLVVRLKVWCNDEEILTFDDRLDLCIHKQRVKFDKGASDDLCCDERELKIEINRLFGVVEQIQEERLTKPTTTKIEISPKVREEAESYLSQGNLIDSITDDLKVLGVVGESGLCAYLSGVSRLMDRPLTAIVENQDLVNRVLPLFPSEVVHNHTSISDKALYYEGSKQIENQIFNVPFIKQNQSIGQLVKHGRISQLTAVKDTETGGVKTQDYNLTCRPMVFLQDSDDDELKDLSIVLKGGVVDEIAANSLEKLARDRKRCDVVTRHQNIQRVLEKFVVVNPFVDQMDMSGHTHLQQYLGLIETITLLHQHQREVRTYKGGDVVIEYIETTKEDIETANRISKVVFRKTTLNEISPTLRNTFSVCADIVSKNDKGWEKATFTRKDILDTGLLKQTTIGNHLKKLEKFDFITRVDGENGVLMEYRLLLDPSSLTGVEPVLFDPTTVAA